jgi:hypothetical protein
VSVPHIPVSGRHRKLPERFDAVRRIVRSGVQPRVAVVTGLLCCLGLAAGANGVFSTVDANNTAMSVRAENEHASRSQVRVPVAPAAPAKPAPAAKPAPKPAAKPAARKVWRPRPVAGLSQTQMDNAYRIVEAGKALGLPKQAYVIAVATAMQESKLYNLASSSVPESMHYPHEGYGSDHDSVGLFQQRASSGWGPVRKLLQPRYAATKFYLALRNVPGWQNMRLTYAAQAVQVSAYPEAYQQHAWRAGKVVDALT